MLIANILSMKMPLSEALAVSLIGISTVIIILAIIAVLILLVSKTIRAIEAKTAPAKTEPAASVPAPAAPAAEGISAGQVELIGTDEKEAAVIMAIVSNKSGIPLERLSFKSIKLTDEEKKGEENK